jgi:adenylate cyclase
MVHFSGEGSVPVPEGNSLLEAALAEGIPFDAPVRGQCSVQHLPRAGASRDGRLGPTHRPEKRLKEKMLFPPNVRLSCQTRVTGGGVKVVRILRDESDMATYVGNEAGQATQQIGQERELVLFFLDIRNFTLFVETHLAFDVIHIVRKLFTAFHAVIDGHGGRVIETAGDGMYAASDSGPGLRPGPGRP